MHYTGRIYLVEYQACPSYRVSDNFDNASIIAV